jgi:hypothetical protein
MNKSDNTGQIEEKEFIDVFSDDLNYILEAFNLHKNKFGATRLNISSTCRLYICTSISCIDYLIFEINKKSPDTLLKTYLTDDSNVTHEKRADAIKQFFNIKRLPIPSDFIADFVILKKLRNIITHSNWRPSNKTAIENAGFPNDVRFFEEIHLNRIVLIHKKIEMALCFVLYT